MKRATLDASVVAAAFVDEPDALVARRLLSSEAILYAPDLLYAEVANVFWKRCGRGELSVDEACGLIEALLELPVIIAPSTEILADAQKCAASLRRTVYDCLYLALAVRMQAPLVSGDRRLVHALFATPFRAHVVFIRDVT